MGVKELLQGRWMNHPLHPALVHIPTGLWPAALVFDLLSRGGVGANAMVRTAGWAIGVGLVAALLAVPAGLADWSEIKREKPAWKLGLYHLILNLLVVALAALNLGLRISTLNTAPRVSGTQLGVSIVMVALLLASGYLGGRMVYDQGTSIARFSKKKWREIALAGGANVPEEKSQ